MKYSIILEKPAQKFIHKQPRDQKERILRAISKLPDEGDRRPLEGHPGLFRLRVGDYRIIYRIDGERLIVIVMEVGDRGQIYKRK